MPAGLRVTFGGKTYPVESIEDAQRKWIAFQETSGAGVSEVGNGVRVTDGAGRFVARISYNGRAWDSEDDGKGGGKVIAEAPDRQPMPEAAAPVARLMPRYGEAMTIEQAVTKARELESDSRARKAKVGKTPTAFMSDIERNSASQAATLARRLREDIRDMVAGFPDMRAEYESLTAPAATETAPAASEAAAPQPVNAGAPGPSQSGSVSSSGDAVATKQPDAPAPIAPTTGSTVTLDGKRYTVAKTGKASVTLEGEDGKKRTVMASAPAYRKIQAVEKVKQPEADVIAPGVVVEPGPKPRVYKTRAAAEAAKSGNTERLRKVQGGYILRPATDPFAPQGGLKQLTGNLGRGVIKVSAVAPDRHVVEAPVRIFHDQESVKQAFKRGDFTSDVIVVVRFQGPRANGMPELHSLTPTLSVLQDRGLKVALVTDGRMSGASGKVPAAIHVSPEAACGGPLARLRDGDVVRLDAVAGTLTALVPGFDARPLVEADLSANAHGIGRELFGAFRQYAGPATDGAALVV
jgi:hypothetical protein